MQRLRITVTGHVQGVFFRASTRDVARSAGCTGWVRNRYDGAVEAEVQGSAKAVGRVVEYCRSGPPQAHVHDVSVEEIPVVDGEQGFRTA
jgi:acylphosphatase